MTDMFEVQVNPHYREPGKVKAGNSEIIEDGLWAAALNLDFDIYLGADGFTRYSDERFKIGVTLGLMTGHST